MPNLYSLRLKSLVVILFVSILFLQYCGENDVYLANAYPDITITVKTFDGVALPNAVVKAYTVQDGNKYLNDTKRTGSDGKVTLSISDTKSYRLEVYYPAGFLVNITENFNYSALPKKEIRVNVLSKWTLRITDKYGRDFLENVKVEITHRENETLRFSSTTDQDGKVQFTFIPLIDTTPSADYLVNISYVNRKFEITTTCSEDAKSIDIKLNLYRVIVKISDVMDRPIEGVVTELREDIQEGVAFKAVSNSTGYAVLKLIPNGQYYLIAKLGEYEVYRSDDRLVKVKDGDETASVTTRAVRLNITVYDFDGESIVSNLGTEINGEIRDNMNRLVSKTSTLEGELRFGHVPLGEFKLTVSVAGITVYSKEYEITPQTAKGSIRANFFDSRLTIDGSSLANSSITRYLKGILKKEVLEIPLDFSAGYVSLENIPAYEEYLVKLYIGEQEVAETKVGITRDEQELSIKIRGKNITVATLNIYDEPLSADVVAYLENGARYFIFKTDNSGLAEVGEFLPIKYNFVAYVMGVESGQVVVQPQSSTSYTINLRVGNAYIKLYDKDKESVIPDALIELLAGASKTNSMTNTSGIAFLRNIPFTTYSYKVYLYGFKVGEGEAPIEIDRNLLEVVAPGILDLRLNVVDAEKQAIDGGRVIISVGDKEVLVDLNQNGQARIPNLPNTTLYIVGLYYKDVKVKTDTREINLVTDEMPVTISASIYALEASVKLKNGETMKFGKVNIYVSGKKTSEISISENNPFTEKLPGGELTIEVVFKNVKVGSKTFTLDSPKSLTMQVDVYKFVSTFYNTLGEKLKGLRLRMERDNILIEELETDENGVVESYMPGGAYKVGILYDGEEYSSSIQIIDETKLSFMLPVQFVNPVILMLLPLVNIVMIFSHLARKIKLKSTHRKKKTVKRIMKIPKI
ncbi:MAG: hypothetical protein QXR41_03490 [Nitrososphaerota archaeon]